MAVDRSGYEHRRDRVAVDIAVVDENARRRDGKRPILGNGVGVGGRRRSIVERVDGERHDHRVRVATIPVTDAVGEAVGATEVERWHIVERPVGVRHDRPADRPVDENDREPIPIDVDVVGEQARSGDDEGGVFVRGVYLSGRHGDVVGGGDDDRHGGRCGKQHTVTRGVGEAVGAVVVRCRGVDERAVRRERDDAMGGGRHEDRRQQRSFGIDVVDKHGVEQ